MCNWVVNAATLGVSPGHNSWAMRHHGARESSVVSANFSCHHFRSPRVRSFKRLNASYLMYMFKLAC